MKKFCISIVEKAYCIICLLLSVTMFSSCSGVPDIITDVIEDDDVSQVSSEYEQDVMLALYRNDSLNPYTVSTLQNLNVLSLCYEPLFTLDYSWTAKGCIAEKYIQSGNKLTVTLRANVYFWDGSVLTPNDVVYSYSKARSSENYKNQFSNISACYASGSDSVTIELISDGVNDINFLTVPIIKENSDVKTKFPIGTGAYFLSDTPSSSGHDTLCLYKNTHHTGNNESTLKVIKLAFFDSAEEILYEINYGNLSALSVDFENGNSMYKNNIELVHYTYNRMIYAFLNPKMVYFEKRMEISTAITHMINRQYLSTNILSGCGITVWYPFNPTWSKTVAADINSDIYDPDAAKQYFYNSRWYVSRVPDTDEKGNAIAGTEHEAYNWYGKIIKLKIIVIDDNIQKGRTADFIAQSFNKIGISASVYRLSYPDYSTALTKGDYDICISETQIPANMDITGILNSLGHTSSDAFSSDIYAFNHGTIDMRTFLASFQKEMPFIPLYYVNGALAVKCKNANASKPSPVNVYNGIEMWG